LSTIKEILIILHKGSILDVKWHISIHSGYTILRGLFNEVDIITATNELTKAHKILQAVIDAGDTERVKRNGSASVVAPLIQILQDLRNSSTSRTSVLQGKARALTHAGAKDMVIQSQKTEVSGQSSNQARGPVKIQGNVTSVQVMIACDLCDNGNHGATRNCFQLESFRGKAKQLPHHICPMHLGRKGAKCAARLCDEYTDRGTGQVRNGLCTELEPPVNFRICGCNSCNNRLSNLKKKIQKMKDSRASKKTEKSQNLWPAAGVPKGGNYLGGGTGGGSAKARQSKVEVRIIEVVVEKQDLESNMCNVNGVPLGSTLCPKEVLTITTPSGQNIEVLALYDSHSQATFMDPDLLKHCVSSRSTGNEAVVIKTYSGSSESINRTIGVLQIPIAGSKPILVEGLIVETKKKASCGLPELPDVLNQMRKTGTLAREPKEGAFYPVILFGADLCAKVFPESVYSGDQAFHVDGFSLHRSKLSSKYIPTGVLKGRRAENGSQHARMGNEAQSNPDATSVNTLATSLGRKPAGSSVKVEIRDTPDFPEDLAKVSAMISEVEDREIREVISNGSKETPEKFIDHCLDCGNKHCPADCHSCVEVNKMVITEASPFRPRQLVNTNL
jgi:hypothetical protein